MKSTLRDVLGSIYETFNRPPLQGVSPALDRTVAAVGEAMDRLPPGWQSAIGQLAGPNREMADFVVKELGTVANVKDASYVLPDGRLIRMTSGRHDSVTDPLWKLKGQGKIPNVDVDAVGQFMDSTDAVRMVATPPASAEIRGKLTEAQFKTLMDLFKDSFGYSWLAVPGPGGESAAKAFDLPMQRSALRDFLRTLLGGGT